MPEPLTWTDEVLVQQQQLEVINNVQSYILEECDDEGHPSRRVDST